MDEQAVSTSPVELTDQQRRVIAACLDVTASFHGAMGEPNSALALQNLRLHVLGDLIFEDRS